MERDRSQAILSEDRENVVLLVRGNGLGLQLAPRKLAISRDKVREGRVPVWDYSWEHIFASNVPEFGPKCGLADP